MKKQVFKTDAFFVENTDDKQSRILRIKDQMPEYFINLAFKESRKKNRRDDQQKKREDLRMIKRIAISFKSENLTEEDFRKEISQLSNLTDYIDRICTKYFSNVI